MTSSGKSLVELKVPKVLLGHWGWGGGRTGMWVHGPGRPSPGDCRALRVLAACSQSPARTSLALGTLRGISPPCDNSGFSHP